MKNYNQNEVKTLILNALQMWDKSLMSAITQLPEDHPEMISEDFSPSNWLFYARGDTLIHHTETVDVVLEEYHTKEESA